MCVCASTPPFAVAPLANQCAPCSVHLPGHPPSPSHRAVGFVTIVCICLGPAGRCRKVGKPVYPCAVCLSGRRPVAVAPKIPRATHTYIELSTARPSLSHGPFMMYFDIVRAATDRFWASVHDGPVAAALGRSCREGPPHVNIFANHTMKHSSA